MTSIITLSPKAFRFPLLVSVQAAWLPDCSTSSEPSGLEILGPGSQDRLYDGLWALEGLAPTELLPLRLFSATHCTNTDQNYVKHSQSSSVFPAAQLILDIPCFLWFWLLSKIGGNSPLFLPPTSKKILKSMAEWKFGFLDCSTCTGRSNIFGYFVTVSRDLCNADIGISRSVFYNSSLLGKDLFFFHQAEENAPCPAEASLSFEIGPSISSIFFEIASISA